MARTHRIKKDSRLVFSFRLFGRSEISIIEKRIRFLERKLIKMVEIDPSQALIINQNIERLTELLAHKKAVKALAQHRRAIRALVANLPPVIHDLVDAAAPIAGAPAAVAAAPAIIPMGFEAQDVEMFNPEWEMVTPVAQVAPAAFPEFDEQAIPFTPQAQMIRTPENPPALVIHAPAAALFGLAPAMAVPATPQAQIIGAPAAPPALEQLPRYWQRGLYTPLRQIITNPPTTPPKRKSLRELAPERLPLFA